MRRHRYILLTALLLVLAMAIGSPAIGAKKIYWTEQGGDIKRADFDGSGSEGLVTGLAFPPDIALDIDAGKMYWPEYGGNKIVRANLDGTSPENLIDAGLNGPWGIALDIGAGKMYWTEYSGNKIVRANLDGTNPENLIDVGLNGPYGIALNIGAGKMYWTEFNGDKIVRADLDGTNSENLIITGLTAPGAIALDTNAGKMYWSEYNGVVIGWANLDGSSSADLISTGLSQPTGIALDIDAGKMYYADRGNGKIKLADLDGTNSTELITGLSMPYGIALLVSPAYSSTPAAPGDTINFGSSTVGVAAPDQTFDVQETGDAELTVDTAATAITGTHAADFSIVSPAFPFTIADGGTAQTVTVACTPSAEGVRTATLNLTSNDWKNATVTYTLTCTAVPAAGYNSAPEGPGGTIDFGSSAVGVAATNQTFDVQETGNADLTVDKAATAITGTHAADFSIVSPAFPFTITDGGADQTVTISCTPSAAGERTATLNLTSNDPANAAVTYTLTCTAVASPVADDDPPPPAASVMYVTSAATAGIYTVGSVISIDVRFSQIVWVSGTPLLVLNTGGEFPAMAYYGSGSETEMLTFLYTVAAGDTASNLEYWSQWALEMNGGRIWDNMNNDVIPDLPAPGAPGSLSGDIALSLDTDYPVYRLYSPGLLKHLFTMDENEKAHLVGTGVWQSDGIAYYAFHSLQYKAASRLQRNTLQAVHRFYSEALQTHLFTIDENEKEHLIANAADVWRYEGPAFYIPAGNPDGAVPVYRFYSEDLTVHLFTVDENEKNHLIDTAGDVWRFEGIAYYAYP